VVLDARDPESWIDRVYAYGFAYGVGEHSDTRWGDRYGEGRLAGKRAMLLVTAGGWASHYGPRGINGPIDDLLFPIQHGVLFYPGYDVLPPLIVYRADRMDEAGFEGTSAGICERMRNLFDETPIPFRQQNGGDYAIPSMELLPEAAPAHITGFAAHRVGDI
jgi:NAD(P)H dehydrogenase (quinone)